MNKEEFDRLAAYAFSPQNPGFKPTVREAPNGDGVWDEEKSYAHLAPKYFHDSTPRSVRDAYYDACVLSFDISYALGLPNPGPDSTMRLLRYPPGAVTAPHTDFDLFTLSLYRSHVEAFEYLDGPGDAAMQAFARSLSPGIHFGELATEIDETPATRHATKPLAEYSESAVFFVIPEHSYVLPSGVTVGDWLKERIARSRKTV